jgi:hypothetical protein
MGASAMAMHPAKTANFRDEGPIVTVTPPAELTDEALASLLQGLEACLARGSPYVLIFDLSHSGVPNAVQRAALATHIRKNKSRSQRWVQGIAVIAPSPLVRGMLTAILWLETLAVPHEVFATSIEARSWARLQAVSKVRS